MGEHSNLKITEDSADMKLSGLSDMPSLVSKVIPDIINPIPFPQTNLYHSSLEELPQVFKGISKDGFPPSLSSATSVLDLIPTKNSQLDTLAVDQPTRIRRSSTPSVFNTLRVDSVPKKDSPGINRISSPIEVFPRVTLKRSPTSQGHNDDLTPDLEFPDLEISDLGEISTLHVNLNHPERSSKICSTKNINLAPIEESDSIQLMGSVYDETGEKIDL
jgi:hypothetical protein